MSSMLRRTVAACLRGASSGWGPGWPAFQLEHAANRRMINCTPFSFSAEPDPETNPAPSDKVVRLAREIENLSVKEVVWLNKLLKESLGISDADIGMGMSMGMAQAPAAGAAAAADEAPEAAPEKTSFNVVIDGFDASAKIKIIKEIRVVLPELGLKEAKALVRSSLEADFPVRRETHLFLGQGSLQQLHSQWNFVPCEKEAWHVSLQLHRSLRAFLDISV